MGKYTFYFDESAQVNKFTLDANGKLNITKNQMADSFIGVFSGFRTSDIESSASRFIDFENCQKTRFGLSLDKEIKSTFIKKSFFRHGLASLRKEHLDFYDDLFTTMSEIQPLLSIVCVSKMEMLVRYVFKDVKELDHIWHVDNIYYVLTKFLIIYGTDEIISAMFNVKSKREEDILKRIFTNNMKHVVDKSKNIPRMNRVAEPYLSSIYAINDGSVHIRTNDKIDFDRRFIICGLIQLLGHLDVNVSDIDLQIDGEPDLYPEAAMFYPNVMFVNSLNEPLIRFSDHIAGFLNRIISAIVDDLDSNEPTLDEMDNDDVDLYSKRLLNEKWFEINEITFEIYRKIYKILIRSQPYYWSTVTMSYSDELNLFYSLLEYFNNFKDFAEYSSISSMEHPDRFNNFACENIMLKRFNEC